jgi:hypothetical protein
MKVENSQLHANDSTCRRGPSDESEHNPTQYSPYTVLETNLRPIIYSGLTLPPAAIIHVQHNSGDWTRDVSAQGLMPQANLWLAHIYVFSYSKCKMRR